MERWDRIVALVTRGAEVVLVVGLVLLVVADLVLIGQLYRLVPTIAVSGVVVVAAVAFRRHFLVPVSVLALAAVLTVSFLDRAGDAEIPVSIATVAGLGVLAASLTRRSPGGFAAVLVPITVVAVVDQASKPANGPTGDYLVVLCAAGITGCIVAGAYLRWLDWQRRRVANEARIEERLDLARELHDLVAHYVTGIVVQAQAAQVVADERPEVVVEALGSIERAGGDALTAMRRMVGSLRANDDGGIEAPAGDAGLRELVAHSNTLGIPARLHAADGVIDTLPADVAGSVHRIVQESLTNARRHAVDATLVDVTVSRIGDAVEITVRDDGLDAGRLTRGVGYGLVGMGERAAALGGTLRAGPDPGGGWSVIARVPLGVGG